MPRAEGAHVVVPFTAAPVVVDVADGDRGSPLLPASKFTRDPSTEPRCLRHSDLCSWRQTGTRRHQACVYTSAVRTTVSRTAVRAVDNVSVAVPDGPAIAIGRSKTVSERSTLPES